MHDMVDRAVYLKVYGAERRHAARKVGLCTRCNKQKAVPDRAYCEACKKQNIKSSGLRFRVLARQGLCVFCAIKKAGPLSKFYCAACRLRQNQYRRLSYRRIRDEVLRSYGGRCTCCSEQQIEFLTIDHIHGGGRASPRAGSALYQWLKKNRYPSGFQVLCWNCNCARSLRSDNICPHKYQATEPRVL